MKLIKILSVVLALAMLCGCSGGLTDDEKFSLKAEKPEPKYTDFGYGIKADVSGDKLTVTYALVGFHQGNVAYIYADRIEKTLGNEKSQNTNRELGSAYGLAYTSHKGEWDVQLKALLEYIKGHNMKLEDLEAIETYEKDPENPSVPAPGTDLAAACELNIGDFIDVLKQAYQNTVKVEAMRIGVGEDIRIYNHEGQIRIHMAIVALDLDNRIVSAKLDRYDVKKGDTQVISDMESEDAALEDWQKGCAAYEAYILGRTGGEATYLEVYDPGDGISTALPKPGTDLAQTCNIDLALFTEAVREAANRGW